MKPYIIVIYGKSSTGKDTLMHSILEERDFFNKVLRTTTRPQRDGEADDNYEFVTENSNLSILDKDKYIEQQFFRGWFYGTRFDNITDGINIMSGSIEIVEELQQNYWDQYYIYPIYLHLDDRERMLRALAREKNPDMNEICRRFTSETEQYSRLSELDNMGLVLDAKKSKKELVAKSLKEFDQFYMERLGVY